MALSIGSKGEDVRQFQLRLRAAGYPVSADGIFGPATKAAAEQLQRDSGLKATSGQADPMTELLLDKRIAARPAAPAEAPTRWVPWASNKAVVAAGVTAGLALLGGVVWAVASGGGKSSR